ncbi:gamma carbonic anhydrase family protein [Leifsonia sp. McL0607]|uniref:gamma carbonic anhydrase family protein n=1 Tax=Leifsonia sp. McL0607 TaxID=3415672 RepID=UPI003CF57D8E
MVRIHPTASMAASAVVSGDVTIGPGARVLAGAVLDGSRGPVVLGEDVLVMEHAVIRGRAEHPVTVGDAVLIGPHTNITGARIEDEVFVATGACVFAGAVVGARSELRVHAVLHVNSVLLPDTVVRSAGSQPATPQSCSHPIATTSCGRCSADSTSPARCTASRATPPCATSCAD